MEDLGFPWWEEKVERIEQPKQIPLRLPLYDPEIYKKEQNKEKDEEQTTGVIVIQM